MPRMACGAVTKHSLRTTQWANNATYCWLRSMQVPPHASHDGTHLAPCTTARMRHKLDVPAHALANAGQF
eukprot:1057467-Alexandrium_andersonii.AAC.1